MVTVRYCPKCGVDRREGDRFCRQCGTPLGTGATVLRESPVAATAPPAQPGAWGAPPPTAPAGSGGPAATPPVYGTPPAYGAPPAPAPAVPAAPRVRAIALLGGLLVAVAALLPWISLGVSASGFDVEVAFLFGAVATGDGFPVGAVLLPLGGAAAGLALRPGTTVVRRILGVLAIAIAGLFVVQVFQAVGDAGGGDAMSVIGLGPFVAAAGGLALLVSK